MSDASNAGYYEQATAAAERGEFEYAKNVCRNAVKQFLQADNERGASEAFHLLGNIAYRQGDLDEAESSYRKALEIDKRTGDERGAALTYNNLSSVANAREDYDAADELLAKSIHINESLANERGLAVNFHQKGVYAESRGDLASATDWYVKSVVLEEKVGSGSGAAMTGFNLCVVAEKQGNKISAVKWRQKALQALDRDGRAATAINIGKDWEDRCEYGIARSLYLKALDIATAHGHDAGQSISYSFLGHLASKMGDHEQAKEHIEKAIAIDERIDATDRAAKNCFSLGNLCLAKINGRRDFHSARKWFRKSLELRRDVSWRDSLKVHAHFWYYRLRALLSR